MKKTLVQGNYYRRTFACPSVVLFCPLVVSVCPFACPFVVLFCPLVVPVCPFVCPFVVLFCPLVVSVCPLVVPVVLFVDLLITHRKHAFREVLSLILKNHSLNVIKKE